MTVLLVLGSLLVLLVVACIREARSGRPEWGSHLRDGQPQTTADAARAGKKAVGATVAIGTMIGLGGGDG